MENKIRSTLNEIYFGKTKDVVNDLRWAMHFKVFFPTKPPLTFELWAVYFPWVDFCVDSYVYCIFTKFRCSKISVMRNHGSFSRMEAQWPIGYGVGLRIKRSSVRIRPWPLRCFLGQGSLLPLSQGEAFRLASISYLAILVKYILAKKKKLKFRWPRTWAWSLIENCWPPKLSKIRKITVHVLPCLLKLYPFHTHPHLLTLQFIKLISQHSRSILSLCSHWNTHTQPT